MCFCRSYKTDMTKIVFSLILAAGAAFGQYTSAATGAPPSELNAAITAMLRKDGTKILNGDKVVCEIWLRAVAPSSPKSAEDSVSLPNIPQGALLGAITFQPKARIAAAIPSQPVSTRCATATSRRTAIIRAYRRSATSC